MGLISKYRKKQLLYLALIFLVFTAIFVFTQYIHEKKYRLGLLNQELDNYSELINNYLTESSVGKSGSYILIDSLNSIIPDKNLRISIIDPAGKVLYDNQFRNTAEMENHLSRPEIKQALAGKTGSDIRVSATTGIKYYYYAKQFRNYFVRVSVVYDLEARQAIEPDKVSLLLVLLLFFISSVSLVFLTDKFGKSVSALKEFIAQASENKSIDGGLIFPENELGYLGKDMADIYMKLNESQKELISEKEKLVQHLNLLDEGVAIFSVKRKLITSNNRFMQYLNLVSDNLVYSAEILFEIKEFSPLRSFLEKYLFSVSGESKGQFSYEINVTKNSKYFSVKCIVFQDKSFEIIIADITKPEKRKLLKQQITDNIAHELKTPVSSIKAFLETLLSSKVDPAKSQEFINRAYSQACRLSDLINDISLLTKIEEAGNLYPLEDTEINGIIRNVIDDVQLKLNENSIKVDLKLGDDIMIKANPVLLYSVFRNLCDNAISHAGRNTTILVHRYMEDPGYYYFSFSDNGTGVPEKDLPRLFERFYRADKGRDRKSGGTGLGLAIVKNAILFHKGEISVKNRKEGGLEFLFTLAKNPETGELTF
jgi:two-component system, OmpR family, phosphate regulon sensor histidine kinase PhoR